MRDDIGSRQGNPLNVSESPHCSQFQVGGVSVALQGECGADVKLVPGLLPFRAEGAVVINSEALTGTQG